MDTDVGPVQRGQKALSKKEEGRKIEEEELVDAE